uniref:Uncharacterized protein n=1 Tax=Arundo donax TaxID=35708 RepID=A0A0A8Y6V2_ARUDO
MCTFIVHSCIIQGYVFELFAPISL